MDVAAIDQRVQELFSPVYRVGGSVRDELLGLPIHDLDYATPLLPDDIEAKIRAVGLRPFVVGKRFGTIGVRINGVHIEITTFRSERYDGGSRKPDVVFVDDLTEDLGRRDFTINAIARAKNQLIDPFNGQADLRARTLRAVGDARTRFQEDPLRMLRLARFAAQLHCTVEVSTFEAVKKQAHTILHISRERWMQELDTLLLTEQPSIGLEVLAQTRLLHWALPELALQVGYNQNSIYHQHTLWEHTKRVVDAVPASIEMRWAALLHDVGKPYIQYEKPDGHWGYALHDVLGGELVEKVARYLKWGNERREAVRQLVVEHMKEDSPLKPADRAAH